jgi:nucleoside-triphosphatase THEP1
MTLKPALILQALSRPRLFLITGHSGIGKTTYCAGIVQAAQAQKLTVGGVLCPAVFRDDSKVGIDLVNLATGERRQFAQRNDQDSQAATIGHWIMQPETLAWGNSILAESPDSDVFVIDELGPLEFNANQGFVAGLQRLDAQRYRTALVVVRPSLVTVALERWPSAQVVDLENDNPRS